MGIVSRLPGDLGVHECLQRVVGSRANAGGTGGAPLAVAREHEAVLRPRAEVPSIDNPEAGRRAAVGPVVAGLVQVADPHVVARAGGADVLPRRRRGRVRLVRAHVADAVEVPDRARRVVAHVERPEHRIVPVLDPSVRA